MHKRLFLFFSVLAVLRYDTVQAQNYLWRNTFPNQAYCVAFNPLSNGRTLFTATTLAPGIFRSDDDGQTWQNYLGGLPLFSPPDIHQFLCVPTDTSVVLAVSGTTLYRSTDGGKNWSDLSPLGGVDGEDIVYYAPKDQLFYAQNGIGQNAPVWRSDDHGATWTKTGQGNPSVTLCTLAVSPDTDRVLLSGSVSGEIDRSTDEGATWDSSYATENAGTPEAPEIPKICYATFASNVAVAVRWRSSLHSIVRSTDRGATWTTLHSPERHAWALELDQRQSAIANGIPMHLWTGLFFQGGSDTVSEGLVLESTDGAMSWHSTGFPNFANPPNVWMLKHDPSSGLLVAATDSGIFVGREPESVASAHIVQVSPMFFPNPAVDRIRLLTPQATLGGVLRLFDPLGTLVLTRSLEHQRNFTLDISALHDGIYFAQFRENSGHIWNSKLVKIEQ